MQVDRSATSRGHRLASRVTAVFAVLSVSLTAFPASAATLEHIKETGHIRLGYFADAKPFTSRSASGVVEGYGASLCQVIAEQVKAQLALSDLTVDWVPISAENALREIRAGNVDLGCTPVSAALGRRQDVAFSIPVFPGGIRAVLRSDATTALREALAENPNVRPVWRGSPAQKLLGQQTVATVAGSTAEKWLTRQITALQIDAKTVTVPDFRTGLQQLRDGKISIFFGDRAYILGAMDSGSRDDFVITDQLFTREVYALALARNDDDFRLLVDRSLSQLYPTNAFRDAYKKWFGEFDTATQVFFLWSAPPQ